MLFSSWAFIAGFLPVVVLLYRLLPTTRSVQWLVLASLFYYGWWNPVYLLLILTSTAANHALGHWIARSSGRPRRLLTAAGVVANLAALGYFKYLDFFIGAINQLSGSALALQNVTLPLAISFFTFQQIAYLVDVHRGGLRVKSPWEYALFVSFFPQLIAGPIVHYREMIPQFQRLGRSGVNTANIAIGCAVFAVGLFKKTVIADGLGASADAVFDYADAGHRPSFIESWCGALAYTFQLYFDFSGYADMAIGAARMFGIVLPANFASPYKAVNIIDFWRRWHMTLSRFLRDYLYIALGGNRHGRVRRYVNLLVTMLLGGLWHGAGWNFVLWGGWHGLMLIINHAWQAMRGSQRQTASPAAHRICAWLLTFLGVIAGWVLFRAETFGGAIRMFEAMTLADGIALPARWLARLGALATPLQEAGVIGTGLSSHGLIADWHELMVLLAAAIVLCLAAPNTQQLFARHAIVLESPPPRGLVHFALTPGWGVAIGAVAFAALLYLTTRGHVEFIYRFF
ncbi:MBOAT family O-acyltransferase [Sinimarinibacterium thermocellulolyticum]|uniref:Probable alginate O-acetylase n=1 Tax=Sinimarinibacterium thermocellulolyticum TaxID=3170016 RepID=A0ABV2ABT0_9GAMM